MSEPKPIETATLLKLKTLGQYGVFQIEIIVGATKLPSLEIDDIQNAAKDAAKLIESAIMVDIIRNTPEALKAVADTKAALLSIFPGNPFVEEIPNGYCNQWCCKHRPWFIVTTQVGRIKIGWRKRVIEIDWTETHRTKSAHELFASEDVTKGERMIHAWSYEDAKRYVNAIISSGI